MAVKFWETAPSSTGPGYTMKSIEFENPDEAIEYAHAAAAKFRAIDSRGSYVVANVADQSHTLELGRKGDTTAAQIMARLTA